MTIETMEAISLRTALRENELLRTTIDYLKVDLEMARRDTKRLDWLAQNVGLIRLGDAYGSPLWSPGDEESLDAAIDAAMGEE